MSLLLHAITTAPEAPITIAGLRGEPLVNSAVGDAIVWWTSLHEDRPPFTREDLLANHHIVSSIFAQVAACLPARFPTFVASEEALVAQLPDVQLRLEGVRDACELAVTATWLTFPKEGPLTGTRYLQRRARLERLADEVEQSAGADLLEARRTIRPSDNIAVSLALLIKRGNAEAVIQRLPPTGPDVRILVNGPWPPYTFVDRSGTGKAQA